MFLYYLVQRRTNKVTLKLLILLNLNNNNKNTSRRQTITKISCKIYIFIIYKSLNQSIKIFRLTSNYSSCLSIVSLNLKTCSSSFNASSVNSTVSSSSSSSPSFIFSENLIIVIKTKRVYKIICRSFFIVCVSLCVVVGFWCGVNEFVAVSEEKLKLKHLP